MYYTTIVTRTILDLNVFYFPLLDYELFFTNSIGTEKNWNAVLYSFSRQQIHINTLFQHPRAYQRFNFHYTCPNF